MQIKNQPATVQQNYLETSLVSDSTPIQAGSDTVTPSTSSPQQSTQLFQSRGTTTSLLAEKTEVLPGNAAEPQPSDLPSAATPGNLAFMPSAKTVAMASSASQVGQDSFAMACVEALDVSLQSPSAYATYLSSIKDPGLKAAVSSFVGQNASATPSSLVDPYGNFNGTKLQQAKGLYPSPSTDAAAASTAAAVAAAAAASTPVTGTASSPVISPTSTPTPATTPTAGNINSWPQIPPSTSTLQVYQQWANVGTYPAIQAAASTVVVDEGKLQADQTALNAANKGLAQAQSTGQAPDAKGTNQPLSYWQDQQKQTAQTLQGDWQNTRKDEANFWYGLSQVNAGAQGQYSKYANDPLYTTEGEMPQGFTSAPLPSASSAAPASSPTPLSSATTQPAASTPVLSSLPAINGTTWPANALQLLTDANGSKSMSKDDFEKLTEDFTTLYQQNPSQYWSTLSQVTDPRLAGALNFATNDKAMYNASSLRNNGASESTELKQTGNYFNDAAAGKFANWAPVNQGGNSGPVAVTPATIFSGTDAGSQAAVKLMTAAAPANKAISKDDFGQASSSFAKLYQSNPQQYYTALTQITDPKMRDLVNYAVLDTLSNHSNKSTDTGYYAGLFGKYGTTGFAGTSKGLSSNSDSTTLNGKGPLSGNPWKQPS